MKATSITITGNDLAAGVDALLAALEPADLAALKSAANRLSRFHAFAYLLLAPQLANVEQQIVSARNEVADTDEALVEANERCDRYHAKLLDSRLDLERQKVLVETLAERCAGQSELLSQRANRAPLPDLPPPERIAEEDGPGVPAEEVREPHPRSNAEVAKVNRLAVARALAAGPLRPAEIVAATGIPQGTMTGVLKAGLPTGCGWWRRVDIEDRNSGYELAEKGREALRAEGYIVPLWTEPKPADSDATPDVAAPKPARDAAVFDAAGARDRARCKLIAGTLAKLIVPLAAFTIARDSALDADDVEKRLTRHPEWFERADCVGIKYKLTRGGRELAAEGEVTS